VLGGALLGAILGPLLWFILETDLLTSNYIVLFCLGVGAFLDFMQGRWGSSRGRSNDYDYGGDRSSIVVEASVMPGSPIPSSSPRLQTFSVVEHHALYRGFL
jgi:hypothetical protein